jgi:Rod binding domain-containing protein
MIKSEFTDDSNTAGIYQDMVTNQLADSLSRGGGIGLAKTFERQLTPHTAHHSLAANPQTNHPAGQVSKTDALLISKPAGHGQTGPHRGPNPFSHT